MSMVRNVVGGVDTHADVHVAAAVDHNGGLLGIESFPADPAGDQVPKVVVQLPLDRQKAVQHPKVKVLETVDLQPLLMRRHPAEKAEVDVVVVAGDVGVVVVDRIVLPGPEVRTASHQVERPRHESVDPRAS